MTAQHTPRPWHAHHDHGWLVVESDNGDLYIKIEKGAAATRRMADARLIAAAPDLLAVVIHARNVLPNEHWADDTRRMLDAAIARATHKEGA